MPGTLIPFDGGSAPPAPSGVFLSYNHGDGEVARRLKEALQGARVPLRIDSESMPGGARIREFIRKSILETAFTVWIVSERSLLSGWVGLEIVTTLNDVALRGERSIIPCYVESTFLDRGFRLKANEELQRLIRELEELRQKYAAQNLDTIDLNDEATRLRDLQHFLGPMLEYLRAARGIDICAQNFATGVQHLLSAISGSPVAAAGDIEARRDEFQNLILNGDIERAIPRLLDFVKEFSKDRRHMRKAIVIGGSFSDLLKVNAPLRETREEREKLYGAALELVDAVVDSLLPEVA